MSRSGEGDDNSMPEDLTQTESETTTNGPSQDTPAGLAHLEVASREATLGTPRTHIFEASNVEVAYGGKPAITDVNIGLAEHEITALIGPSGCGKSTFLRCLNRMNDLIPSARVDGEIIYHGENLYDRGIDPVQLRARVGMVFQKPNPFPKSIYDNIAFGPKV